MMAAVCDGDVLACTEWGRFKCLAYGASDSGKKVGAGHSNRLARSRVCTFNVAKRLMCSDSSLNLALLVGLLVIWQTTSLQTPTLSRNSLYNEKQLERIMFCEQNDADMYASQCGRSWHKLFSNWEHQQRRAMELDSAVKVIVWRCEGVCGGLGDRHRGILTSFMLALTTGRAFFIDNETPVPLRHYFSVANPTLHWNFHTDVLINRSLLEENFLGKSPSIGDYSQANLSWYDQYDVVIQTNSFWQPFNILRNPSLPQPARVLRTYKDHILAGCILNYLLVPTTELQLQVRNQKMRVAQNQPIIAVQIRSGDNQNKSAILLQDLVGKFHTCITRLQHYSQTPYRIFLTTDSFDVVTVFKALHPDVLEFKGDIYHVDGPFGSTDSPDAAFSKVILDHLTISMSQHLIISRSGFAEYAALRGFKSYYTPVDCHPGSPVPHFMLPSSLPGAVDDVSASNAGFV